MPSSFFFVQVLLRLMSSMTVFTACIAFIRLDDCCRIVQQKLYTAENLEEEGLT